MEKPKTTVAVSDPIARIDAVRSVFPLASPITLGAMTIASREFLCVRVTTEAGLQGHAFALSRGLPSEAFIQQVVAPTLVGRDSDLIGERVADCLSAVAAPSHAGMLKRAVSLVEIALWDVKGHRLQTPLWRLLGGARAEVPVLLVGGYLTADSTPEEVGEKLGVLAADGYTLIKVARASTPDLTRRLLSASRGALSAGCRLVVDTHWCWQTSADALQEISLWGDLDLAWLEDPMPPGRWDPTRELREKSGLPIGVGDEVTDEQELRRLVDTRAVDVLRVDATTLGGVGAWSRLSAYAHLSGLMVSPHAYPEVHIHCACAWPLACAVEMFEIDSPYWPTNRFVVGGMIVENGVARAPERPGLGVEIDWECIEHHDRTREA
jgi:L-alanine-DL-glutamate epimerase-like enolase superfamily enzyme